MVKIYPNGTSFLEENLSYLNENKYASSLIVLNSNSIKETNNINYLLKVEVEGKRLLANRLSPYNVLLFGDYECLDELLEFLETNKYEVPGFLSSTLIGDHIKGYKKIIGMDFMEAYEISEPSSLNIIHATLEDVEEIAELSLDFFKECGLMDKVNKEKIIERIDSYRLIKKDNKIVSMARYWYETESSLRISMVYTRKKYRGKGYAKEVVNTCKNEIISQNKIATLNVDQENPISNHLYASLGFKKVFSQGIYIKK